jgi:hypothetical protein
LVEVEEAVPVAMVLELNQMEAEAAEEVFELDLRL